MPRVLVVGCGNPEAADDAVGIVAVRAAHPRLEAIPGVKVVEGTLGPDLADLVVDVDAAVVVDAVRTSDGGRAPGTLVRVEAGPEGLPAHVGALMSSHGFGVAEAVGLSRALGAHARIVLLGLEALDVGVGHPMSAPVRDRLPDLVHRIVFEATYLAAADRPA